MDTAYNSVWVYEYLEKLTQCSGLKAHHTEIQELHRAFREVVYDRRYYLVAQRMDRANENRGLSGHYELLRSSALQLIHLGEQLEALGASTSASDETVERTDSASVEKTRAEINNQIRRGIVIAWAGLEDLNGLITDELEGDKARKPFWQQIADKRFSPADYREFEKQLEDWIAGRQPEHEDVQGHGFQLTETQKRLIRLNVQRRHYLVALQQNSSGVYTVDQFLAAREQGVSFPAPPNADVVINGSWERTLAPADELAAPGTFRCPCCLELLSDTLLSDEGSWRSHIYEDLQHLTCLVPGCNVQEAEGFITAHGWVEHLTTGRRINEEYDRFEALERGEKNPQAVAKEPKTPHVDIEVCPICQWRPAEECPDPAAMFTHLKSELLYFALLSFPWALKPPYNLLAKGAFESWLEHQKGLEGLNRESDEPSNGLPGVGPVETQS
ncbi:uncharacterized protein BO97DRAFT_453097 [Aspergillus homomorphus CBS 101889]|uniref:Uncharacterized protein n=1 Tax=Aspergillus homomorphus (strain CBS 101889) TaxID=1450537 RepID=A0A395I9W7_ASPHC|nr:hypothetical protein BO97DRAFT_453097 [Aspergillus homomorphus CBS 101889]RAL17050.1 hypothetical protein BO97DRAFT_453097 [Aspergillus homomorphus CBS 101889]